MMRRIGWTLAASVAVVVASGCSSEPDFEFGAAEMETAVTGQWAGTLTRSGQGTTLVTMALEHGPSSSPSCGNRLLMGPQCVDSTALGLTGEVGVGEPVAATRVDGEFVVDGLELRVGYVMLTAADGGWWTGTWRGGAIEDGQVQGGAYDGAQFSLNRPE